MKHERIIDNKFNFNKQIEQNSDLNYLIQPKYKEFYPMSTNVSPDRERIYIKE